MFADQIAASGQQRCCSESSCSGDYTPELDNGRREICAPDAMGMEVNFQGDTDPEAQTLKLQTRL